MNGWYEPETAELYDHFARTHALYRETSRDLVDLAGIEQAASIVDLACGTGVTTEAILARARPDAIVTAIDASSAMVDVARRRVSDPRVQWRIAPAVDLAAHLDAADVIVCNAAIWQLDMERAVAAAAAVLRPAGRLAFNIGRQFLMLPLSPQELRPAKPTFFDLIQAVAVLEYDYAPPHPVLRQGRLLSPEAIEEMLKGCGLELVEQRLFEYENSAESQLAWLRVPIFADNALPGMGYDDQIDVFTKAYGRLDKSVTSRNPWMAFVARKS